MRRGSLILIPALLACQSPGAGDARPGSGAPAPHAPVPEPPIGSAHPITVLASAASGRWVVACQSRRDTDGTPGIAVRRAEEGGFQGDAMVPYLIRGGGDGAAIDSFVASSRDDRWIVVVRDRALQLLDTAHDVDRVLANADVRGEASGSRLVAAFDARDEHVVYARQVGDHSRVAIRDLATQAERELDVASGTPWQVETKPASAWLRLTYIRPSAGHGGWPLLVTRVPAGRACRGFDFERRSNAIGVTWLRPDTGELRDEPPPLPDEPAALAALAALAAFEGRSLTWASGIYRITDARTGTVTALPGLAGNVGPQARHIVAIGTAIVDLERARVIGTVPRKPLAVDITGRALVPLVDRDGDFERGPLRWIDPTPTGGAPDALFPYTPPS